MNTKTLVFISVTLLVLAFAFSTESVAAGKGKAKGRAKFELPPGAVHVGGDVYYLGKAKDKGKDVEGYAIIKRKDNRGKPGTTCGNGVCEPGENARKCPDDCGGGDDPVDPPDSGTSGCYEFLSKGAKWKTVEPYMVDPTNSDGLSETAVTDALAFAIGEWETAAGADILGNEIAATLPLVADTTSPDDKNEVYFADIADSGAIGVTIVWGIFGGPPPRRQLVEWDQIYDDADFDWDNLGDPTKMDFLNIAIHELGHSCGLGDLYTPECSEQTMYGYATEGETKKTTLEDGDIAGIQELYR